MKRKKNRITKKRGPKPSGKALPVHPLRMSKELSTAVAEWAEHQPDKPSWSEAMRRLVEIGLGRSRTGE